MQMCLFWSFELTKLVFLVYLRRDLRYNLRLQLMFVFAYKASRASPSKYMYVKSITLRRAMSHFFNQLVKNCLKFKLNFN